MHADEFVNGYIFISSAVLKIRSQLSAVADGYLLDNMGFLLHLLHAKKPSLYLFFELIVPNLLRPVMNHQRSVCRNHFHNPFYRILRKVQKKHAHQLVYFQADLATHLDRNS